MASRNRAVDAAALPIRERLTPEDQSNVAAIVAQAASHGEAVFPLGGQTSLDYGLPPSREGLGLDMTGLNRTVDYAARDMTITVETGIRIAELAQTLAGEQQQLPIDVPRGEEATLGGAIATDVSGPRRYGFGTLRDYVIGVTAVDGRGVTFHGGGRVVKNVAGYDFCKLLIGSLGALAVVTQVTLKVKPLASARRWLACRLTNGDEAETLLQALVSTATTPTAIELLGGMGWDHCPELSSLTEGPLTLAVLLEGTPAEVDWQMDALETEWTAQGQPMRRLADVNGAAAHSLLAALREFPHAGLEGRRESPLVIKAAVSPAYVVQMMQHVIEIDPAALVQCHAGNGIVIARFDQFDAADLTRVLVGRLQSAAARQGGSLTVLSGTLEGLTQQIVWGGRRPGFALMDSVKRQFDPYNILNPGRFIFA